MQYEPNKKVDKTNCCVYGCHTSRMKEKYVSFHLFPRKNSSFVNITTAFGNKEKVERRKAWENALKMGKPATNFMRVCAKHFTKEDYLYETSRKPTLKKTAIPTENLPKSTFTKRPNIAVHVREQRLKKRQLLAELKNNVAPLHEWQHVDENKETEENLVHTVNDLNEKERSAIDGLLNLQAQDKVSENSCSKVDKAVQVSSGDLLRSYTSTITSDSHLNSLTGISSFDLLKDICLLVSEYYPERRSRKLSIEDRVILVFMKLKLAVKFKVLSLLFQIAPSSCRATFNDYVQYVANVLKPCIVWPSVDECRGNMPICFKTFESVRIILDCMEIPVQKPKCRCCRIKTYSHYKGRNTLKFMTGVSPAGLITFVPACYGGRASDKAIFKQSCLIEKLEPHIDSIMVDKGFAIKDICEEYFIKLIQPYFLRKKQQFTSSEAKQNVLVSRARVHVERANQRIRLFEIFNSPLPWNLVHYIDDIFTIACSIVNLQTPILAEDKFK